MDSSQQKAEDADEHGDLRTAGPDGEPATDAEGAEVAPERDVGQPDPVADDDSEDPSLWTIVRDTYFTFDRRTLGFTRLMLGFFLIGDLFRRTEAWFQMFSVEGVLPNHVNLFRPQAANAFSIVNAFSTRPELAALWCVILITYVCLFVGYKTKVAQILSLFFVTGMNGRVLLIENGGYVVHNLLLLWTMFLPLGGRFSVDAMLASMRRSRERTAADLNDRSTLDEPGAEQSPSGRRWAKRMAILFGVASVVACVAAVVRDSMPLAMVTIGTGIVAAVAAFELGPRSPNKHSYNAVLGLVFLLQLSAIYYFNVLHKTGPAWKNGQAVHFVLHVDRMVTPLVADARNYIPGWAIIFMTKTALAFEAAIAVCLLSPLGRAWARRVAVVMINALHLGFGIVFVLGPFAWACCVFSTLLFGKEDWEISKRTMRRIHRARVVVYDRRSPAALLLCRILKRMDNLELLTFREGDVRTGFAVEGGPERRVRSAALADIVAALPVGPAIAWLLRMPGLRHLTDAVLARMEGGRLSRFLGWSLPTDTAPTVAPPPPWVKLVRRKAAFVLGQVLVLVMFTGAVNQALVELWVVNRRVKIPQPEPTRILAHKLRFLQGWFMFSPNPVMDDGTLVVDAITVDGRHIDPFTGKPPFFDLPNARSMRHNQIWCDYFNRMHLPANSQYREPMKDYMLRLPQRTGNPNDALVSGEVYWIQDMNPKWGQTQPWKYERLKLFAWADGKILPKEREKTTPPADAARKVERPPSDEAAKRTEEEAAARKVSDQKPDEPKAPDLGSGE